MSSSPLPACSLSLPQRYQSCATFVKTQRLSSWWTSCPNRPKTMFASSLRIVGTIATLRTHLALVQGFDIEVDTGTTSSKDCSKSNTIAVYSAIQQKRIQSYSYNITQDGNITRINIAWLENIYTHIHPATMIVAMATTRQLRAIGDFRKRQSSYSCSPCCCNRSQPVEMPFCTGVFRLAFFSRVSCRSTMKQTASGLRGLHRSQKEMIAMIPTTSAVAKKQMFEYQY